MAGNGNLNAAKAARNDEFYTRLEDIEKELAHYRDHFRGKIVLCNCDDPVYSDFWKYFHLNFGFLGLRKLIATYYDASAPTYKLEYEGGNDTDVEAGVRTDLAQNGDFRSPECAALLDEADIVVTNPPFSLFREYVAQLMEHGKKFVIIGSMNAITYKEFFPLLKEDRVWLGYGSPKEFGTPGGGMRKFGNIYWYTNLDHPKRHEPLALFRAYDGLSYPSYANYDAVEVGRTQDIPADYYGEMGVPISFLEKYCPEQFGIVGISRELGRPMSEVAPKGSYVPGGPRFYVRDGDGYRRLYDRIVIRRR